MEINRQRSGALEFSEGDRVQVCREIMSLPEVQVQYVIRLIQLYAPHVLKLDNRQWIFDTKALSNDLLARISDYLVQYKSLQHNVPPSGGVMHSGHSSEASMKQEDGSTSSNGSDTNLDSSESKEPEEETNVVAQPPPPLLSNFSFGNKLSKASFSLSKLSIDLDINLFQNLNSLSKTSFSRALSKDLNDFLLESNQVLERNNSTLPQLDPNCQAAFESNLPRYTTRSLSKSNMFPNFTYNNTSPVQTFATFNNAVPGRKEVSFSNLVSYNSAPPGVLLGTAAGATNFTNLNNKLQEPSFYEKNRNGAKRRVSEYNPTKSMDLLTSLIPEENIEQDLVTFNSSQVNNNNNNDNTKLELDNESEFSETNNYHEYEESASRNKRRKKNCPRQPVNKKSLSEVQLQGYFESYYVSNISIFKHVDKGRVKRLLCFECGKTFRGKSEVVVHVRTHTGEKPLSCKYCKKKFAHPSNLKVHERSHRKEKPFKCSVESCNKEFAHNMSLREHLKAQHDQELPLSSLEQQETTTTSSELKEEYQVLEQEQEQESVSEIKEDEQQQQKSCNSSESGSNMEGDKEKVLNFRCVHCKHGFNKRVDLIKHVKLMHGR